MKDFLKNNWFKIAVIMIIISFCLVVINQQNNITKKQEQIEKSLVEQKQLQDNIVRSQSEFVSKKDMETFAKNLNINIDVVKKDLEKLNGTIVGINGVLISSKGYTHNDRGSDIVIPKEPNINEKISCKDCDKYGYLSGTQIIRIDEKFDDVNVPVGSVGFSAWKEKPWSVTIVPRDYNVTTVIGTDEDGRHYAYNKFTINADGKDYSVKIKTTKFVEQLPESKFFPWNPRLYLGFDSGLNLTSIKPNFSPGVHIGIMSYGKTRVTPEWSFIQLGLGYDIATDRANIILSPVVYNIGKKIHPLMQNTYIGPSLSANTDGNFSVSIGLRVGL